MKSLAEQGCDIDGAVGCQLRLASRYRVPTSNSQYRPALLGSFATFEMRAPARVDLAVDEVGEARPQAVDYPLSEVLTSLVSRVLVRAPAIWYNEVRTCDR